MLYSLDTTGCAAVLSDLWIKYPDTNVRGGVANSASHLSCCQSSCIDDASCTRLDWNARASQGQRCWLHGSRSSSQPRRSLPGVTHYELRRSTVANWVIYSNEHALGGISISAGDLPGCQHDCVNNASCNGFDWSPASSANHRCWIHGPWSSSAPRRSAQGVSHYELHRGSDEHCGKYTCLQSIKQRPQWSSLNLRFWAETERLSNVYHTGHANFFIPIKWMILNYK